jgi:SNF2 family DNA or RNA helicase
VATLTLTYSSKGVPDVLVCTPANDRERSLVVSIVGARPHASGVIRFNPDPFIVRDLQRVLSTQLGIDQTVTEWHDTVVEEHKMLLRATTAQDTAIPLEITQHLRDYQRVGAMTLASGKRMLLGDEMGLGKTLEALVATRLVGAESVLIVTMAIAKWQWKDEIKRWLGEDAVVVDGTPQQRLDIINSDPKYLIIHYDILRDAIAKVATAKRPAQKAKYLRLVRRHWDVVVFDEAHKLQGRSNSPNGSQQSKAAMSVTRNVPHIFELTGTPIWNMPDSLWHLLHILDPVVLSSYWAYVNKYCTVEENAWSRKVTGIKPEMLNELKERHSRYILQRLKKDVATELPPKIYSTLWYRLSTQQRKAYATLVEELRLEHAGGAQYFANVASTLSALRKLCNNPRELDLNYDSPKDAVLLELVENALAQAQKVAVLCWHRGYAKYIQELLAVKKIESVLATGEQAAKERILTVNTFKNTNVPVIIGTIAAIGTALNLEYITTVIFAELDWTPPMNRQAEDRFHRLTSTKNVNIYYIIGEGTIEQHILEVTQKKSHIADETLAIRTVVEAILQEEK